MKLGGAKLSALNLLFGLSYVIIPLYSLLRSLVFIQHIPVPASKFICSNHLTTWAISHPFPDVDISLLGRHLQSPFNCKVAASKSPLSTSIVYNLHATTMDVWTCCVCKIPNLMATAPACPICTHTRCGYCVRGPPPQELGSPQPLFPSQYHGRGQSYYTPSPSSNETHYRLSTPPFYTPPSAPPKHASIVTAANTRRPLSTRGPSYEPQYPLQRQMRRARGGFDSHNIPIFTPPSMTGWWKCCHDGHVNNPSLSPEKCTLDGHIKCGYCHSY